MKAAVYY